MSDAERRSPSKTTDQAEDCAASSDATAVARRDSWAGEGMTVIQELLQFNAKIRGFEYSEEELCQAEFEAMLKGADADPDAMCKFVNEKLMEKAN